MKHSPRKRIGLSLGAGIAAFSLLLGGSLAPSPASAHGDPHPAHVHVGDCSAPGEVVAPLTNLDYGAEENGLSSSNSEIELTVADMLAEPHSIVVHESEENIGNYVLCGDITGEPVDGMLTVALGELNGSGMAGLAILTEGDAGTSVAAFALDDASVEGMAMDAADAAHPAHIHTGDCTAPGEVVYPLTDVAAPAEGAVEQSFTEVETTFDELTAEPHSIVAHLSADEIGTYLVCGDIVGEPVDGMLAVPLAEVGGSGQIGLALLSEADGGMIDVWVFLMPGVGGAMGGGMDEATPDMSGMDHGSMMSTPEAASDGAAMGDEVAATIEGFKFQPGTIEIKAGTTVTWTNNDSAPHTVTADDGSFQSGPMNQGDTFSFTFDTPGTYSYFCEYHAGMTATVIVS